MPLPRSVDFDKLLDVALREIGSGVRDWIGGTPTDETALMSHITSRLNRRRRSCDVGLRWRVTMETRLATLHRKGPNQTDRYGCDLGVTVSIPEEGFVKTACIQFKKSSQFLANIDRKQLEDATVDQRIVDRAFVAAADELRAAIRVRSVADLLTEVPPTQKTKQLDCSTWFSISEWINEWLGCSIGKETEPADPAKIEALLEAYTVPPAVAHGELDLVFFDDEEVVPARAWLRLTFVSVEEGLLPV